MRYKVWFYQVAKDAGTVDIHDKMSAEEIRERMKQVERVASRNFWSDEGEVLK